MSGQISSKGDQGLSDDDLPGQIGGGLIATACFNDSLADWRDALDMIVADVDAVPEALARAWGCTAAAGARMATLLPRSGARCAYRLVESPKVADYRPLRSHGWAALEICVADVWSLHETVKTPFEVIGAPKLVEGFDNFIPMQVVGKAGEVLYLNQVLRSMSDLDLPQAGCRVDRIFIAILAAQDAPATLDFYTRTIGFEAGQTWTITYSVINQAFALDDGYKTAMTMTKIGRTPGIEIDQYPPAATGRPVVAGHLPPGVALVSFLVESLDAIDVEWIAPPARHQAAPYWGRRAATVIGPSGERIELIEVR